MPETRSEPRVLTTSFPGGKRVDAHHKGFTIHTDQPTSSGGDGSAPGPFDLFVASLATCAGYFVLEFCRQRDIPTDGIRIEQHLERDPESREVTAVAQALHVPDSFPAKYHKALIRAAESCTVKKLVQNTPEFRVEVTTG